MRCRSTTGHPVNRRFFITSATLSAIGGAVPAVRAAGPVTTERGPDVHEGAAINYAERILSALRVHLAPTGPVPPDVVAGVEVHVAPDGRVTSYRLRTPSGSAVWDDAVLRAVARAQRLPLDAEGKIPAVLTISLGPR